jgi:Methyltransferase domain
MYAQLPTLDAISLEIQRIRAQLTERDAASLSSRRFQNDLLDLVVQNAETGGCIIEIGCYRGGMTAQLAFIAKRLGKRLISVDNDLSYIDIAERTIKAVAPDAPVNFFHGTFTQYVNTPGGRETCILVFIDGLHTYEGVRQDIEALYSTNPLPHIAVFHDFGLRTNEWDSAVDRALFDSFGQDFKYRPIGVLGGPSSGLPTKAAPGPWNDYLQDDSPEAVYIHCADCSLTLKRTSV